MYIKAQQLQNEWNDQNDGLTSPYDVPDHQGEAAQPEVKLMVGDLQWQQAQR